MKLFKKVMSLIIASIMMLQVAAFAAPAPADVTGKSYEDAAKLLSALDIMVGDGNNFNGENNITRAEYTKIMVVAAGHANIVSGYKAKGVFTDVPVSEWYAPYVEFGKDMGAINGMGDGTFAPNENVTGEQAVKMMVSTIGYGLKAEENGGYPAGYMAVAQDIGALKGIAHLDFTAPMTRGQAAMLCANIIDIDVMKKVSSGDVEKWESKAGVTLLTDKFNTYKVEGLVSANSTTALWETSVLDAGEVEITAKGEKLDFLVGETDIDKKIGSTIKAYYTYDEDTEESTIIAYTISSKKNAVVEMGLADIEISDSTNTLIQYWASEDDTKTSEVEVEAMPAILYNGAASTSTLDLLPFIRSLDGMPGTITFMDTDTVKGAETIMITAYDTYVVEFIDAENYTLLDEIGNYKNGANGATKSLSVDVEDKNVSATFVDKSGKELSFDTLQEGDVLSVAASHADNVKQVFNIIVCDDKAAGIVKEFGTDADGKTVITLDDGKDYLFADTLEGYIAVRGHGLKLDKGVEFSLDAFGRIAAIGTASTGEADGEYGIILDYVPSQGTSGSIDMKVFTADGEFKIIPLASKVTIDGAKKANDADIMTALADSIERSWKLYSSANGYSKYADGTVAQISPMLYKLDDTGAIKYIDTPFKGADEDDYTLGKIKGGATGAKSMTYQSGYKGFDYTTALNSGAVIFAIPDSAEELSNDKKLRIFKSSEFATETPYSLQLFNTDRESRTYDYGIYVTASGSGADGYKTGADQSAQRQRPYFIVTKTTQTLIEDEYGDDIISMKIYGNEEGSSKTLTVDPNYFKNGQYIAGNDSIADHLFNGVTYNVAGTGSRTARLNAIHGGVMDEARARELVMPGDIFTYGTNSDGKVSYVRTIYLAHENIFLSKNDISSGRRYESSDFAIPYEKDGSSVMFATISNPASGTTGTQFTVANGYITQKNGGVSIVGEDGKYDPELLTPNMTFAASKVIVYDAAATKEADIVKTGSAADIVDLSNPLVAATPCIVRVFNSGIKVVVVLKNLPDTPVAPAPETPAE